jgi:hypothetical protein
MGTAVALPFLEVMMPSAALGGSDLKSPTRMAFIYVPNGTHMPDWTPGAEGENFTLPYCLEPLKSFQKDLLVLSGLTLDPAREHGDVPGPHSRSVAAFLTGRHPQRMNGIKVGVSLDQFAAGRIGKQTPFPSLELGTESPTNADCDLQYPCIYLRNISWKTDSIPAPAEINPRLLFDRLFAGRIKDDAGGSIATADRSRLSLLDFVMEDARELKGRLGVNDCRKLDEYLNGVRELEMRLARATGQPSTLQVTKHDRPAGIPADYAEHIRLLADMIALAFQADLTRIVTFVLGYDKTDRSYPMIGVPDGHHYLSHHGGSRDKQEKLRKINRYHVSQLAYLLGRLKSVKEGTGTLLDSCMIMYGSAMSDGNDHRNDNLPIILAGGANGTLRTGRHVRYPGETPLTNLYLSMLDRIGAPADSFGDSTGRLPGLK